MLKRKRKKEDRYQNVCSLNYICHKNLVVMPHNLPSSPMTFDHYQLKFRSKHDAFRIVQEVVIQNFQALCLSICQETQNPFWHHRIRTRVCRPSVEKPRNFLPFCFKISSFINSSSIPTWCNISSKNHKSQTNILQGSKQN